MQVRELINLLRTMPEDAYVVIGGNVIHDVEARPGVLEHGYFNLVFRFNPLGRAQAVVFLANTEMSNGEVVSVPR